MGIPAYPDPEMKHSLLVPIQSIDSMSSKSCQETAGAGLEGLDTSEATPVHLEVGGFAVLGKRLDKTGRK